MSAELILYYIPVPDQDAGLKMAKTLLAERLIACANIFPPHMAVYRWDGEVQSEPEAVMILKTRPEKAQELTQRIEALHPYDTPALIPIPTGGVNPTFLQWVDSQLIN